MPDFRNRSKSFLCNLSKAAGWMMSRNVGPDHWWSSTVLTQQNPDKAKRPILDPQTAQEIFADLIARGLLVEHKSNSHASDEPAYIMKYDLEGWDKAVSDGRPIYAWCLKVRRNWFLVVVTFFFGIVLATFENRAVGLIDKTIDGVMKRQPIQKQNDIPIQNQKDNE